MPLDVQPDSFGRSDEIWLREFWPPEETTPLMCTIRIWRPRDDSYDLLLKRRSPWHDHEFDRMLTTSKSGETQSVLVWRSNLASIFQVHSSASGEWLPANIKSLSIPRKEILQKECCLIMILSAESVLISWESQRAKEERFLWSLMTHGYMIKKIDWIEGRNSNARDSRHTI